jgi:hypothetical protein
MVPKQNIGKNVYITHPLLSAGDKNSKSRTDIQNIGKKMNASQSAHHFLGQGGLLRFRG